jgi:uncharacterized protein
MLVALAGLAGCGTATERFYALSAGLSPAAAPVQPGSGFNHSVVVSPAALPELVDRPQLVVRAQANRVTILEQQRWAEPLRAGVARVVAENLARSLGTHQISTRDDVISKADCQVSLDVRRFDAQPDSAVTVETLWTVVCIDLGKRAGQTVAREAIAKGKDAELDGVVAAHGRALDALSRDIALALRSLGAGVAQN